MAPHPNNWIKDVQRVLGDTPINLSKEDMELMGREKDPVDPTHLNFKMVISPSKPSKVKDTDGKIYNLIGIKRLSIYNHGKLFRELYYETEEELTLLQRFYKIWQSSKLREPVLIRAMNRKATLFPKAILGYVPSNSTDGSTT